MSMSIVSTFSILMVVSLFNGSLFTLLALYLYKHRFARPIVR